MHSTILNEIIATLFGRSYTHYQFNGEVYKTKAKFLEAIKDVKYHD